MTRFSLATNKRASNDEAYSTFLLALGDGRLPLTPAVAPNAVKLPDDVLAPADTTYADLAAWVFGDVVQLGLHCSRRDARVDMDELKILSSRAVLECRRGRLQHRDPLALPRRQRD